MRCTTTNVEIDGSEVWLHLGFDRDDGFTSRGHVKITPYEARRLAAELMEAACDAECVCLDEELEQSDA